MDAAIQRARLRLESDRQGDEKPMISRGNLAAETLAEAVTKPVRTLRWESIATVIAAVLPLAFLAVGVLRAHLFVDDVSLPSSTPDDWHTYKQLALSVVRGGL